MLLSLTQFLAPYLRAFNVFNYLSLRAVLAALTAFAIGCAAAPRTIEALRSLGMEQSVRANGPRTHLSKEGTPTMGGVLIIIAMAVSCLLWMDLANRFMWLTLFVVLSYGLIGWLDDHRKVARHSSAGMSAREKFFWQSLVALLAAVYLVFALALKSDAGVWTAMLYYLEHGLTLPEPARLELTIPFFKQVSFPFGALGFIVFSYLVIVGTSNAVNLTDGLDGLAILPCVMVGSALGIFAYVVGRPDFSSYLLYAYIPGAGELVIACAAIAGAGLAFLWFNCHPAEVFMGDVGALALGGALGAIAVITRQEFVLAIMGGIFVVETLSVMIQTVYFRLSGGRRVFRMAPIHHHFELKGWGENQVVVRFWIITFILVLIGLASLKIR